MSMPHFDFARRTHLAHPGWAILFCILWLLMPEVSLAQSTPSKKPLSQMPEANCEGPGQTLDVTAERMTFDRQTQTFLFQEHVRVRRCDMTILCDRLRVFNDAAGQNVERIVFTGNVRMQQGARRVTAERAEYFDAEQKLILTGNPKAWDTVEHNELTGEEIVVFLEEDKLFVKQAHVRFHPRQHASGSP
jgi:lipopolysaccharide export system protein LptA